MSLRDYQTTAITALRRTKIGGRDVRLRDYQLDAVNDLREKISQGSRSPLLQAATGLGKSVIISEIIRRAVERGKSALLLVPRRQLVWQTSDKLHEFGVEHGVIMSGETPSLIPRVQVASVHTLYRRCFEGGEPVQSSFYGNGMPLPPADILIIDEAHANFSRMVKSIIDEYPDAVKIGMTATPCRADRRGLGEVYDCIVTGPSIRWATEHDYLSPLRYFGPSEWDLSGIKIQAGDYHQGQLSKRVNRPKLVGDVVDNWERIAGERITVVFAVDRKHARSLHAEFLSRGHAAEYIDGQTDNDERHEIFRRLEHRESLVLCSVAVVDMGWDAPWAECGVLARPTKSLARYLQAVGRILRPAPGKDDAILIDHTGAVGELGFVDDDFAWTLDGVAKKDKKTDGGAEDVVTITCPACKAIIRPGPQCPECGKEMKSQSKRAIEAHEAELAEIDRKTRKSNGRQWTMGEKRQFFGELRGVAQQRNRKDGWCVHAYKQRIGALPWPVYDEPAREPSPETLSWVKSQDIRQAKRREKNAEPA